MARAYLGGTFTKIKKKRPGIHAKTKTSRSKGSVNYKKAYRGQGRWNYLVFYLKDLEKMLVS